jgi:outer membrane cobalamin receptor
MKQPILLFFVAIMLFRGTYASIAEDAELDDELRFLRMESYLNVEVEVASTKAETTIQSASTVTVIDRQMIEDYNFASISAAVDTLAGIQVYRTAFKHQVSTVRGVLQDHYANKVLIMINGVASWHSVTGEGNLDRLSIHDVERIEVLRGPASVIYGTQAYTGAINIVLRKTDTDGGTVHTGIGNKGAYSVGSNYRYKSKNGLSIFAALNKEEGKTTRYDNHIDEKGISGVVEDYVDSLNATLQLQYQEHSLLINAYRNDEGEFEGAGQSYASGAGKNQDVDGLLIGYNYAHHWNDKILSKVELFYDLNERNFSRSLDDDIRANVLGYRLGGKLRNLFSLSESLGIEIGGDYEFRNSQEYKNYRVSSQSLLANNNLFNRSVYEYSAYAQVDWKPSPAWKIILGSRFTENQQFGSNVSSRGTLAYFIDDKNTIKFIAGQSFRTPSLFELYFITSGKTVFGNEKLKPETADTFELAYQYVNGPFYMQTIGYYSVYKYKIFRIKRDVDGDGTLDNVYSNGNEFSATGLEFELKYLNPKYANIFLNLDYVHGDDGDRQLGTNHYNFKYVPKFNASVGLNKNLGGFNVSLIGKYIGSREGPKTKIDDSVILDLNFAYEHKFKTFSLKQVFSIQNLTDIQVDFPEYVFRQGLNDVPLESSDRAVFYSLIANF